MKRKQAQIPIDSLFIFFVHYYSYVRDHELTKLKSKDHCRSDLLRRPSCYVPLNIGCFNSWSLEKVQRGIRWLDDNFWTIETSHLNQGITNWWNARCFNTSETGQARLLPAHWCRREVSFLISRGRLLIMNTFQSGIEFPSLENKTKKEGMALCFITTSSKLQTKSLEKKVKDDRIWRNTKQNWNRKQKGVMTAPFIRDSR
jgi:hypothetical protein